MVLGCHGAVDDERASEQCVNVSAQIEQAFLDYTESGNLLPGQEPCRLTAASLDPRVSQRNVELVLGQFAKACEIQADACSGTYRELPDEERPPESLSGPPTAPPPYVQQSERATTR
jgi:hypothetical protein